MQHTDPSILESVAADLARVVEDSARHLHTLDAEAVHRKPRPEQWSIQEIIGHLLDSAVNNHHRFIRAQDTDVFVFPRYEQDRWVDVQGYNTVPWTELVDLWRLYNLHLARVIQRIAPASLAVACRIGPYEPVTLGFLVQDYLDHLNHHLEQIKLMVNSQRSISNGQ
jgi:hypothetical protein